MPHLMDMPGSSHTERLSDDLEAMAMPLAMKTTAKFLLAEVQAAHNRSELERTITFANGFTLGVDRDQVAEATVAGLQSVYLKAYETRRDELAREVS
ncbi:hypothetical protein [Pseudomonas sp. KNUC1026]|uniref:hypothetical protein n=1 Tax=Pseudomonas sp. KNUC1026 TaxID=2893890 RepID=UPI001F3554D0|nr:hypothetical protein [Pseudomonas sp. KNUC1026]UFH50300.1 hypothetical protein LN139_03125 [Pseudomonas sp. KNUC1026]